jgi:hypothetical protein
MAISRVTSETEGITESSLTARALVKYIAEALSLPESVVGLVMSGDVTQGYTVRTTDVSHTVETEG